MSTDAAWWSLTFFSAESDILTTIAFGAGAAGVHELDDGQLRVYVRGDAATAAMLCDELRRHGAGHITTEEVVVEDWLQGGWTEPRKVGTFTLHPIVSSNEVEMRPDHIAIIPGMGFGTGDHATTAMMLEAMGTVPRPATGRVLDVGTGSGVLAIAAAKLWNCDVLAIDIDNDALANARENAQLNGVSPRIEFVRQSIAALPLEQYPLILANLYAELLVEFREELTSRCNPNGMLLLSGILEKFDSLIRQAFCAPQWGCVEAVARAGWMGYVFNRNPQKP